MYKVIKSLAVTDKGKIRIVYGIKSSNISVKGISVNKVKIVELCKELNRLSVSELHFLDIVEDSIDEIACDTLSEKLR